MAEIENKREGESGRERVCGEVRKWTVGWLPTGSNMGFLCGQVKGIGKTNWVPPDGNVKRSQGAIYHMVQLMWTHELQPSASRVMGIA